MTTKEQIEQELYAALEAIEQDDLVTARQCTARANWDICERYRERNKGTADGS